MKRLDWNDTNTPVEFIKLVQAGEDFAIVLTGPEAASMAGVCGATERPVSENMVLLFLSLTLIATLAGLTLFAFAKDYDVTWSGTGPNGTRGEVKFSKRK